MTLLAAIDIGSNALRFAVGTVDTTGTPVIGHTMREAVRLGGDVFSTGIISASAMEQAIQAIEVFCSVARDLNVLVVRAVATSAVREARNQKEFLASVRKRTGVDIEIIDGAEEARLVHLAVREKVELGGKTALLMDIGGGSVELSLVMNNSIVLSESIKVGAVRMLQILGGKDQTPKMLSQFLKQYSYGIVKNIKAETKERPVEIFVGTGGNIEALGGLKVTLLRKPDPTRLSSGDLDVLIDFLAGLSLEERVSQLKLRPDRADVVFPAAIILQQIVQSTGVKEIIIPQVGLREGIILDTYYGIPEYHPPFSRVQPVAYALELGRRLDFEERHGVTVARHSLELFKQTSTLHNLDEEAGMLLEIAAILHDIGQVINMSGHHKHSYYIIKANPFVGISLRQKQVVAAVARYHRKSGPSLKHEAFALVHPDDRDVVRKLSALIRIADALDREHVSRVSNFDLSLKGKEATLSLDGDGECLLEKWALKKKCSLFEEVFGVKFSLKE